MAKIPYMREMQLRREAAQAGHSRGRQQRLNKAHDLRCKVSLLEHRNEFLERSAQYKCVKAFRAELRRYQSAFFIRLLAALCLFRLYPAQQMATWRRRAAIKAS